MQTHEHIQLQSMYQLFKNWKMKLEIYASLSPRISEKYKENWKISFVSKDCNIKQCSMMLNNKTEE